MNRVSSKSIIGLEEITNVTFKDNRGKFLSIFKAKENIFSETWQDRKINQKMEN